MKPTRLPYPGELLNDADINKTSTQEIYLQQAAVVVGPMFEAVGLESIDSTIQVAIVIGSASLLFVLFAFALCCCDNNSGKAVPMCEKPAPAKKND